MTAMSIANNSNIVELSFHEIAAVIGGNGSKPAPTCPSGTKLDSATYNGNGDLTSYTCKATSTTDKAQEGASLLQKAADVASKIGGLLGF
jgi:hypothetical protein